MRHIHLTVGIVQRVAEGPIEVLLVFDPHRDTWRFIVGERLEAESPRETILREIAWRLNLDGKKDLLVAHMPLLCVECVEPSVDSMEETHFNIEFYPVHLYGKRAIQQISLSSDFKWFSCREVCSGRSNQGTSIDPQIVQWLNRWQVIQPWN